MPWNPLDNPTNRPIGPYGMKLSIGNRKVGNDTLTFNMGSGTDCPSAERGLCRVVNRFGQRGCFSRKCEQFQHVLPRRREQEAYWLFTPIDIILADLEAIVQGLRGKIKYFRFNEAGDFHSQECIERANAVSVFLRSEGIIPYCNSARSDLDFQGADFIVRGSGWKGPSGETQVIVGKRALPTDFSICPMDCRRCNMCKIPKGNIAFLYH